MWIIRVLLISSFTYGSLFGLIVQDSGDDKEKQEILRLKQELNEFYNKKEEEYQSRKKELDDLLLRVERTKKEIEDIKKQNQEILNDIKGEVASKTAAIYNTMKPKNAAEIFDKMIAEGKINDVFDIIVKLKTKNITDILRYLNINNAAILTKMMQDVANQSSDE
ncbi:MotE family protein [Arcobacter sp. FWKO B]|uniref:MotE family protein n=1 Tax=Arcobacter sp. FWKO B TaxID=2593672 RepID=UPI0018A4FAC1|nr:hypothetical protein [Arcobacter sp. FWKO B]QOG12386.1 hypothetical protein FWKOB_06595 [Arcobacter sp. FWKO B]